MADVLNTLAETELTKVIERILVSIYLYDRDGIITKNNTQAYTEKIIIKKDICSKSITQDYADINKYGKGVKAEVSIYGSSSEDNDAYKIFSLNSIDEIPTTLIRYLFTLDNLNLSVYGNNISEIWIDRYLSTAIFTKFANVFIELNNSAIEIEGGDIRLKSFSITGTGSIKLKDSLSITSDNVNLDDIVLSCSENKIIECNFIADTINLNEITVVTPITIYTACEKSKTYNEYKQTFCNVNQIAYNFSENDDINPKTVYNLDDTSIFDNALLSAADFYNVNVSGVEINNAYCYKGVRFYHLNELRLSGLTRETNENIGDYTIGISDINRIYINDVSVLSGHAYAENNEYVIFIGDKNLSNLQSMSVNNITIKNLYLMNLSGCNASEITISNCTSVSESFIQTDRTCNVTNLTFSELNLTTDHALNIYCPDLYIQDSTINVKDLTSGRTNEFNIVKSLRIKNSRLSGDDSTLKINMLYDSSADISDSEIIFKNFEMKYVKNEYEEVFTGMMLETDKVIYFKNSNVTSNESISINDAYRLSSYRTSFNSKKISISNIKNVSFNEIASTYSNMIEYLFSKCSFKNTVLSMRNVVSDNSLNFDDCTGSITYKVEDIASSEVNAVSLLTTLKDSDIDLLVDTIGLPIKVNLISDNSVGSVFGNNSSISIIPSMKSSDIANFNSISSLSEADINKINYGNSDKELTAEGYLLGE